MTELLDIFDEDFKHIGVKSRADVHRDGDWHQVFQCWVIGREADGREFLILQMRGPHQDTFPNMLDISAAGHMEAGETVEDGVRELEEELGLKVEFEDLISLGKRVSTKKYKDLIDCQVSNVFLYECNQPLGDYQYQKIEIDGLVKLRIDDGLKLFSGQLEHVEVEAVGLGQDRLTIKATDFIQTLDNYVLKILILAKRYFANEKYLLI